MVLETLIISLSGNILFIIASENPLWEFTRKKVYWKRNCCASSNHLFFIYTVRILWHVIMFFSSLCGNLKVFKVQLCPASGIYVEPWLHCLCHVLLFSLPSFITRNLVFLYVSGNHLKSFWDWERKCPKVPAKESDLLSLNLAPSLTDHIIQGKLTCQGSGRFLFWKIGITLYLPHR